MQINDRIYGKIEIKDAVLVELINSKPLQRLKKISQDGACHYIQPIRDVTRFEHSIGVWYLSHKYNRPIEEQIAALLHDVPHTAFSHVIDFVVHDEKHEFHEKFIREIVLKSEIPKILKKHKLDLDKVLAKKNFPLLENDLPDLSVDRWDYFMRDGFNIGFLPNNLITEFLNGVYLSDKIFFFKDQKLAALFAILFASFSRLVWLDPTSHGAFFLIAEPLKIALKQGSISESDFFTDDETLMMKLRSLNNKKINGYLNRLKPRKEFIYASKKDAEFWGPNKPRFVDPLVQTKNGFKRISSLVPSLAYYFEEFTTNYKYLGVREL